MHLEHICHHFWVGATANPPKSDDRYAQLTRGVFIINDFLQNPHFNKNFINYSLLYKMNIQQKFGISSRQLCLLSVKSSLTTELY